MVILGLNTILLFNMKLVLTSDVIIIFLLGMWSVNSENSSSNLWSRLIRRQSEKNERPELVGKNPLGAPSPFNPTLKPPRPASRAEITTYALSDGSENVVGVIKTTFSCDNRIYGYYADPDNNCQVFHVCVPRQSLENGLEEMIQYSFFCGSQTVFDQAVLACNYPNDAFPCSESPRIYDEVNRHFGITERPTR